MGCLATEPDLPAEATDAPAISNHSTTASEESAIVELPLWYSKLVEPPTWQEPAEPEEPGAFSRLFWRGTIARWPIDRRQKWGDRANELQDAGFGWKEAERVAFEELMEDSKVVKR
jgi:hypothetical protein